MKITPVNIMPVNQTTPANMKKDQTGNLYIDAEDLKKAKKESDCAGHFSMTEFRLSSVSPANKILPPNPDSFIKSYLAESYEAHRVNRNFKTFIGWIVDTVA